MKKRLLLLIIGISFLTSMLKEDVAAESTIITINTDKDVMLFADGIVTKYRIYNGQMQYRRWNETRKFWVDLSWINMK